MNRSETLAPLRNVQYVHVSLPRVPFTLWLIAGVLILCNTVIAVQGILNEQVQLGFLGAYAIWIACAVWLWCSRYAYISLGMRPPTSDPLLSMHSLMGEPFCVYFRVKTNDVQQVFEDLSNEVLTARESFAAAQPRPPADFSFRRPSRPDSGRARPPSRNSRVVIIRGHSGQRARRPVPVTGEWVPPTSTSASAAQFNPMLLENTDMPTAPLQSAASPIYAFPPMPANEVPPPQYHSEMAPPPPVYTMASQADDGIDMPSGRYDGPAFDAASIKS